MKTIMPDFYNNFKCTASSCTDTCCAGWEIDIDNDTLEKYRALKSPLGDLIRNNITTTEDCSFFTLKHDERCPFLNENNLCEIIIQGSEDLLCEICNNHPRFFEWYDGYTEQGIGLCCEEACKLLLHKDIPLKFLIEDDNINDDFAEDIIFSDNFFSARNVIFEIIHDTTISKLDKINEMLQLSTNIECELFGEQSQDTIPTFNDDINFYKNIMHELNQMEAIDDIWTTTLNKLNQNLDILIQNIKSTEKNSWFNDIQWQNILCYIIYRHFPKALYDGFVTQKLQFAIKSIYLIDLLNALTVFEHGKITTLDKINNLKLWSKQVEYNLS